ncbi:MAG TPA: CBS domain-containing protein [Steroidobacteraceae bacterium]|nr:CBS domain-containing protein [Steroidobacteraceae bacterium]
MLLKDVCTPDVVCCGVETTVREAARLMRARHVGDLVVVDDVKESRMPLGIVTDRDLVIEVLAGDTVRMDAQVGNLMHRPVVIAREGEDTEVVVERMRMHGVRRVPVVDAAGAAVGIVTLNDLLRIVVEGAAALVQIMSRGQNAERRSHR